MRARTLSIATLLMSCLPAAQGQLLRDLHNEQNEVRTAESSELAYRAHTPELGPLLHAKRSEVLDELGPGTCDGEVCHWRMSTQGAPLQLELTFANDEVQRARWISPE